MERLTIQVGAFEVNCSILYDAGRAVLVDPGAEGPRIISLLASKGLEPAAILLTHGHFDHIGAIPDLQRAFPGLPVHVSAEDRKVLTHPLNRLDPDYPAIPEPANIRPGLPAELAGARLIPTPGHTPGGVCCYIPDERLLLAGDTLFAGSVGRTDLPGGDMRTLMNSLEQLKTLPPDTVVIPGHGPFTTIERELAGNPFLQ